MAQTIIHNKRRRSSITVIQETPSLEELGKAGIRCKLDNMLLAIHGQGEVVWQKLSENERQVLRHIAIQEDPAYGLSHQVHAIGALAELKDKAALLQLSELAQNPRADLCIQVAATSALGETGGKQAQAVLRNLLSAKAPEVRAQAAKALVKTGNAADLAMLDTLAEKDQTFAAQIARKASAALRIRLGLPD